jgi:hypothetical protein
MPHKKIKILNLLQLRSHKEMREALIALETLTSKLDEVNELNDALTIQFENYEDLSKINEVIHLKSQVTLASKIYSEMQKVEAQKNLLEKEAAMIKCRVSEINFKRKNILSRIDKVKLEIDK